MAAYNDPKKLESQKHLENTRQQASSSSFLEEGINDERSLAASQLAAMSPEEYGVMEKNLLRKMDLKLIPWMTLLYLLSFVDRVNVGTAKLVGLTTELNLTSLQYSNASMIFFVPYVFFEVPSNMLLKKLRPSRWIPFTMICWAIFQTTMGLVTNYQQLLALRFCLGLFESGLFPGLNFYLTGWYKRDEINRRCAFFFGGAVLAGAFGGILGYGLSKMDGVGGKQGWSWIFIIEGLLTFVAAVASFWMIHDWPDTARFLTPLEREMVLSRLRSDQGSSSDEGYKLASIKKTLSDWKVYALMLLYMGAGEPLYSVALFTPTIISYLGTFTTSQSLLLSVPPYVLMFFTTMVTAWLSDKTKKRGPFLMGWSLVGAIGYLMLLTIPIKHPGALYFAVFVAASAIGPLIATSISWAANTTPVNTHQKSIAMGLIFSAGNSAGIISSQVYRNRDAPRFKAGHATALAFCLLNFSMAALLFLMNRRVNRQRDEKYGPSDGHEVEEIDSSEYQRRYGLEGMSKKEILELGEDHPAYRFVL